MFHIVKTRRKMMNKNVRIAKELVKLAKELNAVASTYNEEQIKLLEDHGFKKVDDKTYELNLTEFTLKTIDNSRAGIKRVKVPIDVTTEGSMMIEGQNFIDEAKEIIKILEDFGYKEM